MKTPENWSQLKEQTVGLEVAPAQALRPGVPTIIQYVEGGVEYLAVNMAAPYGTETEAAFTTPRPTHVLEGAARGADFTTFVVPEEVLALQALTRGTGVKRAELLHHVYHGIGELLGNLSQRRDVKAPLIRVRDLAVDRLSGEVLLIPPLSFGRRSHTVEEYRDAFLGSIDREIDGFWPDQVANGIKNEVIRGVEDGSRTG